MVVVACSRWASQAPSSAAIAWLVLLAADLNGADFSQALSPRLLWAVLSQTSFGWAWIARALIAAVLVPLMLRFQPESASRCGACKWLLIVLSSGFLGSLAWSGHAAGAEGVAGALHRLSDVIHLVAAGVWVGGLVPLAFFLRAMRPLRDETVAAVRQAVTPFLDARSAFGRGTADQRLRQHLVSRRQSSRRFWEPNTGIWLLVKIGLVRRRC